MGSEANETSSGGAPASASRAGTGGFAALTIVWLWPVLRHPMDVVPGQGAGDNLTFVWNTWSMHHAIANGQSPLWTPMLFDRHVMGE